MRRQGFRKKNYQLKTKYNYEKENFNSLGYVWEPPFAGRFPNYLSELRTLNNTEPAIAILRVMGCRSFQNIALGGLCKTHNLL